MRSILKIAFQRLARERRKAKCDAFFKMPSDNLPESGKKQNAMLF